MAEPRDDERATGSEGSAGPASSGRRIVSILLAGGALILALAAIGLLGCGGSDAGTTDTGTDAGGFPVQFVTDDDIAAQQEGSPERALLEWWQAFQFADAVAVEKLTSQDTLDELGAKDLAELVKTRGRGFQGIEVLGSTEAGDIASVRVGLLTFRPEAPGDPPPDQPTASTPQTFEMSKEGGEWLFASPEYLAPMIENLQASEQQAQAGSGSSEK